MDKSAAEALEPEGNRGYNPPHRKGFGPANHAGV